MSEDVKLEPHEAVFSAIARHVTVTPQDGRFLITVGHGLVDDPIYELYNTEQSANDTAHDLVSVLSVVIGDVMTQREQAAYERGKAEERARCAELINAELALWSSAGESGDCDSTYADGAGDALKDLLDELLKP